MTYYDWFLLICVFIFLASCWRLVRVHGKQSAEINAISQQLNHVTKEIEKIYKWL